MIDARVISIGALASHPLRDERGGKRTGHGTTVLIRGGGRVVLVDPSLPEPVLAARLDEHAGLSPGAVTHVFLTSFNPELRRGLGAPSGGGAFDHATWWISESEREHVGVAMATRLRELVERGDRDAPVRETLELDVAILKRCAAAPDTLVSDRGERADLFPLPGVTPGLCGVLLAGSRHTTLICGDAVPTVEHLEQGKVLQNAADVALARQSFAEAIEIADLLILGRDNLVVNPTKRAF